MWAGYTLFVGIDLPEMVFGNAEVHSHSRIPLFVQLHHSDAFGQAELLLLGIHYSSARWNVCFVLFPHPFCFLLLFFYSYLPTLLCSNIVADLVAIICGVYFELLTWDLSIS